MATGSRQAEDALSGKDRLQSRTLQWFTALRRLCQKIVDRVWFESLVFLLILVSVLLVLDEVVLGPGSPGYEQLVQALAALTWIFVVEPSMRLLRLGRVVRTLRLVARLQSQRQLSPAPQSVAILALVVCDTGSGRSSQDTDARTVVACLTIEKLAPEAITCAELASSESEPHLRLGRVDEVVLNGELSGSLLAQAAIDSAAARVIHNLLHPSVGSCAFTAVLERCRDAVGAIPIAVRTADGRILINPDSYCLQSGDQLLGIQGSSIH